MSETIRFGTDGFIQERADVENEDKRVVHGPKPPKPASGRGNVFFIGPRASGKSALGALIGEQLGRPFTDEPSWEELAGLVKQGGQVAAISPGLLDQDGVSNLLHRGGKVFYIMVDAATLSARISGPGAPENVPLREELYAELSAQEPRCMQVLHFILQGTEPLDELAQSVLEKLRITGDA